MADVAPPKGSELERLLLIRADELLAYQGPRLARSYLNEVNHVLTAEQAIGVAGHRLSESVARNLYKLLAYKDEYEVARLHLDPIERARMRAEFGADAKFRTQLHPPLLRAMGLIAPPAGAGRFVQSGERPGDLRDRHRRRPVPSRR